MKKSTVFLCTFGLLTSAAFGQIRSEPENDVEATLLNINTVSVWIYSDGRLGPAPSREDAGITFPNMKSSVAYQAGLLWAGKVVGGDGENPEIRAGGSYYRSGLSPEFFPSNAAGDASSIWRVRRDFAEADLTLEAAQIFGVEKKDVSEEMVRQVYEDYLQNWKNWPASAGAPFYDADGDGKYTPRFDQNGRPVLFPDADEPGTANADQVIWFTANDYDTSQTAFLFGSPPMGLKVQITVWGYKKREYAQNSILANTVFIRHRLIHTGWQGDPHASGIQEMYVSFWADLDIGNVWDDLSGTDPELDLGYSYNSTMLDEVWMSQNLAPPAFGVVLVQGPITEAPSSAEKARFDFGTRSGFINLRATSAWPLGSGEDVPSPFMGNYEGTRGIWNVVRGYYTTPYDDPRRLQDIDGTETPFPLSGDPVTGTGSLDKNPGDSGIFFNTGRFFLAKGDTNEVIHALVAGLGASNIASVAVMRQEAKWARFVAEYNFGLGFEPVITNIENQVTIPENFRLFANYPNPFNPGTTIRYYIPARTHVRLTVHNLLGQVIATLVDAEQGQGEYAVLWNGRSDAGFIVPAGVYFYELQAGAGRVSRKMALIR